jgi:hypothetical protein
MLSLILYLIFPPLCVLAIPQSSAQYNGSIAERLVYGIALYEFLLLVIGLALGLTHQLSTTSYLAVIVTTAILLGVRSWNNGFNIDLKPVLRWIKTRRGLFSILMASLVAMVYAIQLGIDARYGTKHYDGLWYHIPRIIFWLQQGNFDAWPTPVWPQIGLPVGADIVLGHKIFLGSGWLGIGYVSYVLSIGAIACVYIAAFDLGLSKWNSLMSAILFSSFPAIGLRIWSVNSDITAAFPLLAAYVILRRIHNIDFGIAIFIVLNGIAIACKQTIIFQAALLACVVFWQCRHKLAQVKSYSLIGAACILSISIVIGSFLPVYKAFGDLEGGDGGRGHKVTSVAEFNHALGMSTAHWLLEPLGYVAPLPQLENQVKSVSRDVYNLIGANFDVLPEAWKPWPAQDIGRSGLVPLIFLPILLFGLPPKARVPSACIFLLGFIPLSGILYSQPWFARYTIALLAGYALIWGGTHYFRQGNKRWILLGVAALNIFSLLGVVLMRSYVDITVKSKPDGPYYFISDNDRRTITESLNGRPLHVITDSSLDTLLTGPDISFKLNYLMFPAGSDLLQELKKARTASNWIAIVHEDDRSMLTGPAWHRPRVNYRHDISFIELEKALQGSGWRRYKQNKIVDLWEAP